VLIKIIKIVEIKKLFSILILLSISFNTQAIQLSETIEDISLFGFVINSTFEKDKYESDYTFPTQRKSMDECGFEVSIHQKFNTNCYKIPNTTIIKLSDKTPSLIPNIHFDDYNIRYENETLKILEIHAWSSIMDDEYCNSIRYALFDKLLDKYSNKKIKDDLFINYKKGEGDFTFNLSYLVFTKDDIFDLIEDDVREVKPFEFFNIDYELGFFIACEKSSRSGNSMQLHLSLDNNYSPKSEKSNNDYLKIIDTSGI